MVINTLKYILGILIFITLFSCEGRIDKKNQQLQEIGTYINTYNRFSATNETKQAADSVGKLLLAQGSTEEVRKLLRNYILLIGADRSYIDQLFKLSRRKGDLENEAHAYFLLGRYFNKQFQTDSTFYNYTKAEYLFKTIGDSVHLEEVYAAKAVLLLNHNIFTEGQSQIIEAMSLNREHKSIKAKYSESLIMANALAGLDQYEEALKESAYALTLLENNDIKAYFNADAIRLNKLTIYTTMAEVYIKQGNYGQAKELINNTINNYIVNESMYDSVMLGHLLFNLAEVDLLSQNYAPVEANLKKAIALQQKFNNKQELYTYKALLAEYYYQSNQEDVASELLQEVMKYTETTHDLMLEKKVLTVYLKYSKENYNHNFMRYESINKQILNENNMIKNTFARLSYEADNLQRVNDSLLSQKKLITRISAVLFFTAIVIFFTLLFKQKSKEIALVKLFQKDTEKFYDSILDAQNELTKARDLERKEISKEIHDGVLNKLFVTRFLLMQTDKNSVDEHKEALINEVKDVELYLRGVSHALANKEELRINRFEQLIHELVEMQNRSEQTTFRVSLAEDLCIEDLDNQYKVHIYRIIQECLQNVHKHAKATRCDVTIKQYGSNSFKVMIKDNGVGFKTNRTNRGIGFTNIKERITAMNSKLVIDSKVNKGTSVSFVIECC
ncbi:tetratricopeptide repeat-containing sensor histidine kinase [Myroides pelagicus]|uniref:histidine kinase n=1 Tax=Myroides pelagicus TaxID=270914 RepID=A0A7K1GH25_9FLAO|nr:tetratricopeptide repeat-containing sensor histidine kinase [Myroides pelagicus]MTH28351.1 two-component sensor histidine kinase [Myroides pelagicus]